MTDRYFALTVLLSKDLRSDDCEAIIQAIKMIRGVQTVDPVVADPTTWAAEQRARADLGKKILDVIYPPDLKS